MTTSLLRSLLVLGLICALINAQAVDLGTAAIFAVLGASTVTNIGATLLNGDLGVYPGTSITGFPPGTVDGVTHVTDAVAQIAQNDAVTAYGVAAGLAYSPGNDLTGKDLGGRTLVPEVYHFDSTARLTDILTLDAAGDSNGVFVFQIGSTLIAAPGATVVLLNGAQACNILASGELGNSRYWYSLRWEHSGPVFHHRRHGSYEHGRVVRPDRCGYSG